jgi:hypothetical protein
MDDSWFDEPAGRQPLSDARGLGEQRLQMPGGSGT